MGANEKQRREVKVLACPPSPPWPPEMNQVSQLKVRMTVTDSWKRNGECQRGLGAALFFCFMTGLWIWGKAKHQASHCHHLSYSSASRFDV